jgi:hypothetical protein
MQENRWYALSHITVQTNGKKSRMISQTMDSDSPLCMVKAPSPNNTGQRQPFIMMHADLCFETG